MARTQLEKLIEHLRHTSRTRVGLWRMPLNKIGHEAESAIRIGAEALDVGRYLRERIPAGAEFVRLSEQKVLETLDHIASTHGESDCVLSFNLDLLLAGVSSDERQKIWQSLFNGFPNRTRVLLISVPETAVNLLPTETHLEKWQSDARLI